MSYRNVISNFYKYPINNEGKSLINHTHRRFSDKISQKVTLPIQLHGIEGRYATCLYTVCVKLGVLDKTFEDMKRIRKDLQGANALTVFVRDPIIQRAKKVELLKDAAKRAEMTETTGKFLALIAENKRLNKLRYIIDKFNLLVRAACKEVFAEVTVTRELTEDQKKNLEISLRKFLKNGEQLKYEIKINPAILGGMIIAIGDKYIDMSIARKIQFYKNELSIPADRHRSAAKTNK